MNEINYYTNKIENLINNNDYSVSLVSEVSIFIDNAVGEIDDKDTLAIFLDKYLMYYNAFIYTEDGEDYVDNFLKYILIVYSRANDIRKEYWYNIYLETIENKHLSESLIKYIERVKKSFD